VQEKLIVTGRNEFRALNQNSFLVPIDVSDLDETLLDMNNNVNILQPEET
jgi:hypothetical protein